MTCFFFTYTCFNFFHNWVVSGGLNTKFMFLSYHLKMANFLLLKVFLFFNYLKHVFLMYFVCWLCCYTSKGKKKRANEANSIIELHLCMWGSRLNHPPPSLTVNQSRWWGRHLTTVPLNYIIIRTYFNWTLSLFLTWLWMCVCLVSFLI